MGKHGHHHNHCHPHHQQRHPIAPPPQQPNQQQIQHQAYQQWLTQVRALFTAPLTKQNLIKYRYFRFIPLKIREGGGDWCVQLSLLQLKYKGRVLNAVNASNPGGNNPPNEDPRKAIDGNINTKWLDNNRQPLVLDFGNSVEMDAYTWATANDCPFRDAISWRLEGSNDGQNWFLLDIKENYPVHVERHRFLPDISP